MKKITLSILLGLSLGVSNPLLAESGHDHEEHEQHTGNDAHAAQDEHEDHDEHGHEDNNEGVKLSARQQSLANIKVATLSARIMNDQLYAPGEIKANGYTSYLVSPRVDSVVLRRHVTLGEHVEKGQPLVTLFSETVAESQAAFRLANAEWKRVKKLGRKAVGDKRFVAAQTDFDAAYARLVAFGLSEKAINSVASRSDKTLALGEYTLNAKTSGIVLDDDFHQGQRVQSGDALMELADEHELWVEARLSPTIRLHLPANTPAKVKVGNDFFAAKVTQEAHTIDRQTRTRIVRLLVDNHSHRLHPGLFADVYFSFATDQAVFAVPEDALMRSADGDWVVFVEQQPEQFKAEEVGRGRSFGQWREITGLPAGTRVVTEGAFFVASQIAKGGFDPHNH